MTDFLVLKIAETAAAGCSTMVLRGLAPHLSAEIFDEHVDGLRSIVARLRPGTLEARSQLTAAATALAVADRLSAGRLAAA